MLDTVRPTRLHNITRAGALLIGTAMVIAIMGVGFALLPEPIEKSGALASALRYGLLMGSIAGLLLGLAGWRWRIRHINQLFATKASWQDRPVGKLGRCFYKGTVYKTSKWNQRFTMGVVLSGFLGSFVVFAACVAAAVLTWSKGHDGVFLDGSIVVYYGEAIIVSGMFTAMFVWFLVGMPDYLTVHRERSAELKLYGSHFKLFCGCKVASIKDHSVFRPLGHTKHTWPTE